MSEKIKKTLPIQYGVIIGNHEVRDEGNPQPLADAIVYIPIIRDEGNNSVSLEKELACFSVDGHTQEPILDSELFQVYIFLTKTLSESKVLEAWQYAVLSKTIDYIKKLVGVYGNQGKEIENKKSEPN